MFTALLWYGEHLSHHGGPTELSSMLTYAWNVLDCGWRASEVSLGTEIADILVSKQLCKMFLDLNLYPLEQRRCFT